MAGGVWCPKCKRTIPWDELNTHKHNLRIRVIPDDHPLAQDSEVLPLHERARIMQLGKKKKPNSDNPQS